MNILRKFDINADYFKFSLKNQILQKSIFGGILGLLFFFIFSSLLIYYIIDIFNGNKEISVDFTSLIETIDEVKQNQIKLFGINNYIEAELSWLGDQSILHDFNRYFRPVLNINDKKILAVCKEENSEKNNCKFRFSLKDLYLNSYAIYDNWKNGISFYNLYWGLEPCSYLLNHTNSLEGKIMNSDLLHKCDSNLEDFFKRNENLLEHSKFQLNFT